MYAERKIGEEGKNTTKRKDIQQENLYTGREEREERKICILNVQQPSDQLADYECR